MGNNNNNGNNNYREKLVNRASEKVDKIMQEKIKLEKKILREELNNRGLNDRFSLKIFMYSELDINTKIRSSIIQYDPEIFDWQVASVLINYSEDNTNRIINECNADFENNNFKNVIILPIPSFSYFRDSLEREGKDILINFNDLSEEQ